MSYTLSESSRTRLMSCDERLRKIVNEVSKHINITVLEGFRPKAAQDLAVAQGRSKTTWPNSKHNEQPSLAVDIAPYPIDWNDTARFYYLAGFMKAVAIQHGVKLRYGGDWDSDNDLKEEKFKDLPHFELES